MRIVDLAQRRQLKSILERIEELDTAMDNFEGEPREFGGLLASRYLAAYKAEQLKQQIKAGPDHES